MNAAYHTTADERAPRICQLIATADTQSTQALLEIAIQHIGTMTEISPGASSLAAQIAATMTPSSEPAYAVGDQVRHYDQPLTGWVTERYLNERGDWEYQIRSPRFGYVWSASEEELTA